MARITIAELNIDTAALIKSTSDLKKQIDALKKANKELAKSGDTSSKEFVENTANIKALNKAYNQNIKLVAEQTQATADQANRTKLLNLALETEAETIEELRAQNKALTKLRNTANLATKEGAKEVELLNNKLDENNKLIKENLDELAAQKTNVGNYTNAIKEAFDEINIFNGGITGFISRAQKAGGAGKLLTGALKNTTKAVFGLTKSLLTFIATPVGALVAVIAAAFLLVQNALNRSAAATGKLSKAFAGITGIFSGILKLLEPIGNFLIDVLVVNLELVQDAFFKTAGLIAKGLRALGFDSAADSIEGFTKSIKETAKAAQDLADAEGRLVEAQRKARITTLQFQKDAEKLRQIRDDETKSFRERIKANEDLGATLQTQLKEELRLANEALKVAELRLKVDGETTENLDARADALTEIADIEERITGQESEQLTNRVQLQREANQRAIDNLKAELDIFLESQGIKARSLEEEIRVSEGVFERRKKILEKELANRNITQKEFDAELLKAQNELLKSQADATLKFTQIQVDQEIAKNERILESDKFLSEEQLKVKKEANNNILKEQKKLAKQQLLAGEINQQEYNARINEINEENRKANQELELERAEQQRAKELIDLENKRARNQLTFEEDQNLRLQQLELERQQEVKEAEKTGADVDLINKKFADAEKRIRQQTELAKIDLITAGVGQAKGLFKENTLAFKAFAIAEAVINTYKAASLALSTYAYPVGGIFAGLAIGQGLLQVSKIAGVKFEKGGLQEIGGKRHSAGGTKFMGEDGTAFEAEKGELIGVMNRNAAKHFMAFNNSFPAGRSRTGFYQGGGVITQAVRRDDSINTLELASITEAAVAAIPPQVITVEDINAGLEDSTEVITGADL